VISSVSQRYGDVDALDSINLTVEPGEFLTLLGPSGCGKTTLLRIIAGFIQPTSGRVTLGERDITGLPAHRRPVNMVFQRSTLFPHMNVYDNVAFGLTVAKVPKAEISERVSWALNLVRLDGFEGRRSHEMSGGQTQRVALARALVNRPKVLLLDEPLSALDLRIRLEMEVELRRVHRETGATFVYVTHDQREALSLSDRIAVFNEGHIDQVADPQTAYKAPASVFAARFVGVANVLPVRAEGGRALLGSFDVGPVPDDWSEPEASLVLRAEDVRLGEQGLLEAKVMDAAYRGTAWEYELDLVANGQTVKAEVHTGGREHLPVGHRVWLSWEPDAVHFLPPDKGSSDVTQQS
jgi:ABC-type Fe3+/spermidine/putrescine transport system ATPase subunit